jgi:hypothetical protein
VETLTRQDGSVVVSASIEHAAALADMGRWEAARDAYAAVLEVDNSADAHLGLARACWWSGETRRARDQAELAFAAYDAERRYADAAMAPDQLRQCVSRARLARARQAGR